MQRFMSGEKSKFISAGFAALILILIGSFLVVSNVIAYYGLGGLYGGGLYGMYGLGGLGGMYGLGGLSSLYGMYGLGGLGGMYGLGGLSSLYGMYGLGGLGGMYGMYGLGGLGGLYGMYGLGGLGGMYGMYGLGGLGGMYGLYGLGLGGLMGGLYGLGGVGTLLSSLLSSPQTAATPVMPAPATATVSALLPLVPLPLFIAEQAGTWMGTWTNGLLAGQMTLNLIDALGLITGTAQLLGNPSLGSLVDVTGTALNAQITLSGTGVGLGGMTFALDLVGILVTAATMTGTYSIINTSGGTVVDQGRFELSLIAPII
ncbi:MAG: hypothetical protein ACMUIL_05930 [bacterium]